MKKLLSLLLVLMLTLAMFTACGKKPADTNMTNGDTQNADDTDKTPLQSPDTDTKDENFVAWETKDIDFENELPSLYIDKVIPFPEYPGVSIDLLFSPVKIKDNEEVYLAFLQNEVFKDCQLYVERFEKSDDMRRYTDIGIQHKITSYVTVHGYKDGEECFLFTYRYKPSSTSGVSSVTFKLQNVDMTDARMYSAILDVLTKLCGEKLAAVMVCAKDPDETTKNQNLYEKVFMGDQYRWYELERTVTPDSATFSANIEAVIYGNSFDQYSGEYKSIAGLLKYDMAEMFGGRLGSKADVEDELNAFDTYMAVGGIPDIGTALREYNIHINEVPDGTYYSVYTDWRDCTDDVSLTLAQSLTIEYTVKEDEAGNIQLATLDVKGSPTDRYTAGVETTEARHAVYREMLPDVIEELKLVFGDGIDTSSIKLENFNSSKDDDGNECIPMDYSLDASFELFGEMKDVTVTIEFKETFYDTFCCVWSFNFS